jgi:hypothetical protein
MRRLLLLITSLVIAGSGEVLPAADQAASARAASGNCVTTGTPPPTITYTYRTVQGGTVSSSKFRWPEVTSEGSRLEVTPAQLSRGQGRLLTTTKHRFENDLVLVDSYTTTGTNAAGPFTTRTVHRPALVSGPALHVCRGQTWRSGPVQVTTTAAAGRATIDTVSVTGEVVSIHDPVSVEAGTFDTVHFRQTQSSSHSSVRVDIWRSIEDGATVKMESTSGGVTALQTLVSRR